MKNNNLTTAAILDMDGTLLNSKRKLTQDAYGAFQRLGVDVPAAVIEQNLHWYSLANQYGISKEQFDKEFDKRKNWKQALADGDAPLYEDTLRCLDKLKQQDVVLGLLTRSSPEYTFEKIKFHNLGSYFGERIIVTPVTLKEKTAEAIALAKTIRDGNGIENFYFIGDRSEDYLIDTHVSNALGVSANGIWLNRDSAAEPEELRSRKTIKTLDELPGIIGGVKYGR